jgi:hypothetical protein
MRLRSEQQAVTAVPTLHVLVHKVGDTSRSLQRTLTTHFNAH